MQARLAEAERRLADQEQLKRDMANIDARRRAAFGRAEVCRGELARAQASADAEARALKELEPLAAASRMIVTVLVCVWWTAKAGTLRIAACFFAVFCACR